MPRARAEGPLRRSAPDAAPHARRARPAHIAACVAACVGARRVSQSSSMELWFLLWCPLLPTMQGGSPSGASGPVSRVSVLRKREPPRRQIMAAKKKKKKKAAKKTVRRKRKSKKK